MIILIITLIETLNAQCEELSFVQYNSQLRSGLLPTNLFPQSLNDEIGGITKYNTFLNTVTITNGWTLIATNFFCEVDSLTQIYSGEQTDGESGQITVSNPTIITEIGLQFKNGTIENIYGLAILNNITTAQYKFDVDVDETGYSFSYVSSDIDFSQATFKAVYLNYPYQNGELESILEYLNTNNQIQAALNQYYQSTTNNRNLEKIITSNLEKYKIIKTTEYDSTFTYGSGTSKQSFTFTISPLSLQIQYTPYISYLVEQSVNIKNLETYQCNYPITSTTLSQVSGLNAQLISIDVIANAFNYAFNNNYFKTVFNPQNWKVPLFSWTTGGLNNIISSVYTKFAYGSQIGGSCSATDASFIGQNSTQLFSVSLDSSCSVTTGSNTLFTFEVVFNPINIGIGFSKKHGSPYFKIDSSTPDPTISITPNVNYTIDNINQIQWWINKGIQNSFINSEFYEGVFSSERIDPQYEIDEGIIQISNTK